MAFQKYYAVHFSKLGSVLEGDEVDYWVIYYRDSADAPGLELATVYSEAEKTALLLNLNREFPFGQAD